MQNKALKVGVIGGGAAGFFAALSCKQHHPTAQLSIFEKSLKLLSKVKVSGGGRCNVSHHCFEINKLIKNYPRGATALKKVFAQFAVNDTIEWFAKRGVKLKTEADGRMFPLSNTSQSIIDCFINECKSKQIDIQLNKALQSIQIRNDKVEVLFADGSTEVFDKLILACGGSAKMESYAWLKKLGIAIVPPIPSLFTFNMPQEEIKKLPGIAVDNVQLSIQGEKISAQGAVLITHWGMSGPAVLKLSAFAAKQLHALSYHFVIKLNWLGSIKENELRQELQNVLLEVSKRKISNKNPFQIPQRLWDYLLHKNEINPDKSWENLSKKETNKLINTLINDEYKVEGKTTFKEEFVTCGGVDLQEINMETMQSKQYPNLYFCGELLDIDGITGGFNFQAAWSTAFVAGMLKTSQKLPSQTTQNHI
jgi:predicted Rossmann fold flavoprotein